VTVGRILHRRVSNFAWPNPLNNSAARKRPHYLCTASVSRRVFRVACLAYRSLRSYNQ